MILSSSNFFAGGSVANIDNFIYFILLVTYFIIHCNLEYNYL